MDRELRQFLNRELSSSMYAHQHDEDVIGRDISSRHHDIEVALGIFSVHISLNSLAIVIPSSITSSYELYILHLLPHGKV